MNNSSSPYDIAIVGLGMVGVHQITREVEETIRRSRHLFITDVAVGVRNYLNTLCSRITDLTSMREAGIHRMLIYRRMASEVVAAALDNPVCFAAYGHPYMYCYPTTLIQRAAQILDLRTIVLPGISSLDTLMADLGIDPGADGLQIYEATDVVIRQRPLQTDVGCVIYQAPIVLEPLNQVPDPQRGRDKLRLLQNYLVKFYPQSHSALFVTSKTHPLLAPITQRVQLGQLAETLLANSTLGTLYIPPVYHRAVADEQLAQEMALQMALGKPNPTPVPARRAGRPGIGPRGQQSGGSA